MKIKGLFEIGTSSVESNKRYCVAKIKGELIHLKKHPADFNIQQKYAYVIYDTKTGKPVCERHALYAENTRGQLTGFLSCGKKFSKTSFYKGEHPLCLVCHRYAQIGCTAEDFTINFESYFPLDLKNDLHKIYGITIGDSAQIETGPDFISKFRNYIETNLAYLGTGTSGNVYKFNDKYAIKVTKITPIEYDEFTLPEERDEIFKQDISYLMCDYLEAYRFTQTAISTSNNPELISLINPVYPAIYLIEKEDDISVDRNIILSFSNLVDGATFFSQINGTQKNDPGAQNLISRVFVLINYLGKNNLYHGDPNMKNMIGTSSSWKTIDMIPRRNLRKHTHRDITYTVDPATHIMDYIRMLYYFMPVYNLYDPIAKKYTNVSLESKNENGLGPNLDYVLTNIKSSIDTYRFNYSELLNTPETEILQQTVSLAEIIVDEIKKWREPDRIRNIYPEATFYRSYIQLIIDVAF